MRRAEYERCPNCGGYLIDHQNEDRLIKLPCHKWTCPYCGEIKKALLLDDVSYGGAIIQSLGRRWRFLTLTLALHVDSRQIDHFWARFRATLAKHGHRMTFFKVKEFTKNGQRHIHAIIDIFIPWNLIKHAWYEATEHSSYIVYIKSTQVRSAAGYMSKYMTKDSVQCDRFDKGERRYSFSKNFPRVPKAEKIPEPGRYEYISNRDYMDTLLDAGLWYESDSVGDFDNRRETAIREAYRRQGTAGRHQQQTRM